MQELIDQAVKLIGNFGYGQLADLARLASVDLPGSSGTAAPGSSSDDQKPRMESVTRALPDLRDWDKDENDVAEIARERVADSAARIRYLLRYFTDELWPYVVGRAVRGDLVEVQEAAADSAKITAELGEAAELWEIQLSELYQLAPAYLGYAGEMVAGMESLLADQASRKSANAEPENKRPK